MTADDHPYRQPKPERRVASAAEVLRMLERGETVRSIEVVEPLDLGQLWSSPPRHFVDCRLHELRDMTGCAAPVRFTNCELGEFFAMGAQFHRGLVIEACVVYGRTDLSCGGHNGAESPIVVSDTRFNGFVDFFDSVYEGPFTLRRCVFGSGTNLLNSKLLHPPELRVALIEDNEGDLAAFEPRPKG